MFGDVSCREFGVALEAGGPSRGTQPTLGLRRGFTDVSAICVTFDKLHRSLYASVFPHSW